MKILKLSISQLVSRPFNSILSICMFALGMGIISLLIHFEQYTRTQVTGSLAGIDLVAGAKGSPLQLIMSSVLHLDNPTGNISLDEANKISGNPLVEKTIPIALGDNFKGFRIVGTTEGYVKQYQGQLKMGEWNKKVMEVLIGSKVSENTGLKKGDVFTGVHGFMEEGHHHEDHKYNVTGILLSTGTVLDRLIITNIESVWHVHETQKEDHHEENEHDHDHGDEKSEATHDHGHDDKIKDAHEHDYHSTELATILHKVKHHEELSEHELMLYNKYKGNFEVPQTGTDKEITALLVFYRSPMAATTLPRMINQNTSMQAASPSIELNRLMSLLGFGFDTLRILAWVIIMFSGVNIMIHLLNKLNKEIHEVALLRALGVGRLNILLLLFWQGVILAVSGWITGIILIRIAILIINATISNTVISLPLNLINKEYIILFYALGVGMVSAIIPAIRAYKTDIHFMLNKI